MKKVITLSRSSRLLSKSLCILSVIMLLLVVSKTPAKAIYKTLPVDTVEIQETVHILTDDEIGMLYSCNPQPINDTCICLSMEDAEMLMKVAVLEDYTDEISQAYIMSIILNRVESDQFPNTVQEVIEQEGQFLKLTDKRYKDAVPDVNSHLALALIEGREIKTDFLFYEALWVKDSWASKHRGKAVEYGGSRFYK